MEHPGNIQSSQSELKSLLIALATFGITFFVRPLGAILLGAFADRHGRKSAFLLTICLMMFGTAIIAVLPTYAVIGPLAPLMGCPPASNCMDTVTARRALLGQSDSLSGIWRPFQ